MESTMCFFVAPPWVWFSQAGNLQPVHEQFFPMYLLSVPEALNFGGIFVWCLEMPEPMPIEWDLWVNAVKLFEDKILLASFGPKSCTGWFREYLYLIYHIYIYLFIFTGQSFLSVPTGVHQTVWPVRIQNWPFGITLVSQRVVVTDAFFFGGERNSKWWLWQETFLGLHGVPSSKLTYLLPKALLKIRFARSDNDMLVEGQPRKVAEIFLGT